MTKYLITYHRYDGRRITKTFETNDIEIYIEQLIIEKAKIYLLIRISSL